jgi:hypothetical protein
MTFRLGVLVVVTATAAPGAGTRRETGPASASRSGGQARPARAPGKTGTDVNPLEVWVLWEFEASWRLVLPTAGPMHSDRHCMYTVCTPCIHFFSSRLSLCCSLQ